MKILGVETSTGVNSIAIIDEERVLIELTADSMLTHSACLMSNIDFALKNASMKIQDLDGFAVSAGPGSFTGLRVGFSLVKGLSFTTKKPLVAVPSLDALAFGYSMHGGKINSINGAKKEFSVLICPMIDAKKNEVYFSLYSNHKNNFVKITGDKSLLPEEAAGFIKKTKYENLIFMGDGAVKYFELLKNNLKNISLAPVSLRYSKASTVAELGLVKIKNKDIEDFDKILPFYLRKPDAEIARRKNRFA